MLAKDLVRKISGLREGRSRAARRRSLGPARWPSANFSPITVELGGTVKTLQFFSYVLRYSRRKRFSFFNWQIFTW